MVKIDFFSDINKGYETSLNYKWIDRFMVKVLWWHFGIFTALAAINSFLQLAAYYPSPFAWRVISAREAIYGVALACAVTITITFLRGKIVNHYVWRILVTVALVVYSYLFVFISGGSIEMHFHFFIIIALLVIYADWRLGWILLVLTGLHHGILNYVEPGWVFFYGRNDLAAISHTLPVLVAVIFTSFIAQKHKNSFYELNLANKKLEESYKNVGEKADDLDSKIQDLEESKKATVNLLEDLNLEKVKDEAILKSIGDGLVITDGYGRVTLINEHIEKMLGVTRKEVLGKWIFEVFKALDSQGNAIVGENSPITQALLTGKPVMTVRDFFKKDGSKIAIGLTVSPIIADEKPLGAILIFRDVTKEREIDRMKTEFISLASHQLRTPLSAMRWFLEMLLAGDAGTMTPEQKEMIKNVDTSNNRMIELVNSLLNVSRIESGRIIVEPVPTDLSKLLEGIRRELTGKLTENKQTLLISVYQNLPLINIDPKLINEVYLNLLTNAIKYSPKGGEIHVFVSKKDDRVISQVSDSGYGIPAADRDQVFQKFYRGDNIVKLVTEGNGLGLYLVKAIIESSQGQIWFESVEGKGTSFWFSLPISGMRPKKGDVRLNQ